MKVRTPTPLFDQAHIAPLRVLTPTPLQSPSKDGRLSTPYAGEGGSGGAAHPFSLGEKVAPQDVCKNARLATGYGAG